MEYEYTGTLFRKASEAVIAVENGAELFVIEDAVTFRRASILNACANFDKLCTRKEKAIDFAKEFTIDTPWMVSLGEQCEYTFAYACCYMPMSAHSMLGFIGGKNSKKAHFTRSWQYARHLTKEEEAKYLGAEK